MEEEEEEEIRLFNGVVFQFDISVPTNKAEILKKKLIENGAIYHENSPHLDITHYISNSKPRSTVKAAYTVLPIWVEAALRNGILHEPKFYYPDATKIFRGVVVTCEGLPKRDNESIYGMTLALGGQYRVGLNNDVTHLVCLAPDGPKYKLALGPLRDRIKIVLPHWFDECAKLRRYIQEEPFLFPSPTFLYPSESIDEPSYNKLNEKLASCSSNEISTAEIMRIEGSLSSNSGSFKDEIKVSPTITIDKIKEIPKNESISNECLHYDHVLDKQLVYPMPDLEQLEKLTPKCAYFQGHVIYIHPDVTIKPEIRACLFTFLTKAGAKTTNTINDDTTIVIMKYRTSTEYRYYYYDKMIIASLFWLTNTFYRECLLPPLTTIWDYPVPKGGIPGMENMLITVSGYVSGPRTLLYRLCVMVGAKWTPNLESETTHLICSKKGSEKYKAAKARNCVIVNHLWLEECYQQWTCKSVADARYTYFPENDILQSIVGKTPLLEKEIERWGQLSTIPEMTPYVSAHNLYGDDKNKTVNNESDKGKLAVRGPRKAALNASTHLRDVLVPDMNQYNEQEKISNNSNNNNKRQRSFTLSSSNNTNTQYKRAKPSSSTSQTSPLPSTSSISNNNNKNNKDKDDALPTTTIDQNKNTESTATNIEENEITEDYDTQETLDDHKHTGIDLKEEKAVTLTVQRPTKLAFSGGVVLTNAEQKGIKKLGCTITEHIREASHLVVTDKIIRTPKFLCALNLGTIIVTFDWLKQSIKQQSWCDPLEYLLNDPETEDQYGFTLYQSLLTAQQFLLGVDDLGGKKEAHGTWLQGYNVCMIHSAKGSALKDVVETAGGKWITPTKQQLLHEAKLSCNLLILANKVDSKKSWTEFTNRNIRIYNTDAIVIGTFRQKLELEEYILA